MCMHSIAAKAHVATKRIEDGTEFGNAALSWQFRARAWAEYAAGKGLDEAAALAAGMAEKSKSF